MPQLVRPSQPRVPNPADPAEDYADKWAKDPALEQTFWLWHSAVQADLAKLPSLLESCNLDHRVQSIFRVELTRDELRSMAAISRVESLPASVKAAPALVIPSAPRPWGQGW